MRTNAYEVNELNEFGYVKQPFLDVHDYKSYPEFSRSIMDIFCGDEIQDALSTITGSNSFNLMQGMLFDANTGGTYPHQECWYLDTIPNGHLIIAWIALEDIDEKAGRFYVLPKSDHLDFHSDTPNISHSEWLERIKKYVDSNRCQITTPDMKRGDVMFLNSKIIHGSLPTVDPSFSRKSLTAHYIPSEYKFGNLGKTKEYVAYKNYKGSKFFKAHPDYSLINKIKFDLKAFIYNSPLLIKILRKAKTIFTKKS